MKVILFGGNFDPPTLAHLELVRLVAASSLSEEVWILPAGDERYDRRAHASFEHRCEMLRLMLKEPFLGHEKVKIVTIQQRGALATSYTIDTLRFFESEYPEAQFSFLLGSDRVEGLSKWKDSRQLFEKLRFAVVQRGDKPAGAEQLGPLIQLGARFEVLSTTSGAIPDISSSEVRHKLRSYQKVDNLVAPRVAEYLRDFALYLS